MTTKEQVTELMKLADDYATKTADFAKNIFCTGADSMSPIAVQAGDARMALQTALEALATAKAVQQPKVIQVMGLNVVLDPTIPPDTMKLVQPQAPKMVNPYITQEHFDRAFPAKIGCVQHDCEHCKAQAAEIELLRKERDEFHGYWKLAAAKNRELQAKLDATQAQKPIGCGYVLKWEKGDTPSTYETGYAQVLGVDVYYAAPVVQQPLTQAEVVEGFCNTPHNVQYVSVFDAGVRFAEKRHNIGGQQP